jgi:hypothetical protein
MGVSHSVGQRMSYCWVLPESGIPISVTTVQRMTGLAVLDLEFLTMSNY